MTEKQWKNTKSNDENLLKRVKVLNKQKQLNDGLSDLYTGLLHNRKGQIEMAIKTLQENETSGGICK